MLKKNLRKIIHLSGYPALKRIYYNNQLRKQLRRNKEWKIVLGASRVFEKGWIPTEIHQFNLLKPDSWLKYIPENSVSIFLAEHVWEHLTLEEGLVAARTCYRYLKPGGHLRIAVPDGNHPNADYIACVKPGGWGYGADDHKVLYHYKMLEGMLVQAGFNVKMLEYFDENGQFHFNEWKKEEGMIHRSSRYDERNVGGLLNYTSLIVDGIKADKR